ncbi:MAG: hypothetical protein CR986_04185 [Ignavibacteriae bacterium]|nr:MAG: hypothetical protein CR986_04185 [Ignavibacteriota bacterium]
MKQPLLIDFDGVLQIDNKIIEDTKILFDYLKESGRKACILSNSSLYGEEELKEMFNKAKIKIEIPILTTVDTSVNYLQNNYKNAAVYVSENILKYFNDFLEYQNPEAVLIGDIGEKWNYTLMQTIFEFINNGAKLIAMHKNNFWQKPGRGIVLDSGTFVHALEFATNKKAKLIGKPSRIYFESALKKIGCSANEKFIMLGDDLISDMEGAKNLNAETILIYTGKTKPPLSSSEKKDIDYEVKKIKEVVEILKNKG